MQALVTIAVPSLNQGRFLDAALSSIFAQNLPVEVFVADGGSCDETLQVLAKWEAALAGWRSHPDAGQAAAINECIARGSAPYVAWLNSDDLYLEGGLRALIEALEAQPSIPAAYGRAWHVDATGQALKPVWTEAFEESRLAYRCVVCQPATLMRRAVWQELGGLDTQLDLAFDYDLWWRVLRRFGPMHYLQRDVACNRDHDGTKTRRQRKRHYQEAMAVVRRHHGRLPSKWWLAWPYAVWMKSLAVRQRVRG